MASSVLIPVSEYLSTTYRPDCDYIDGEVRERNVGERPHARLQILLGTLFENNRKSWGVVAMGDQRVQVSTSRYRIPDLCIVRSIDPADDIVRVPPLLCIEILSKGDSLSSLQERVDDYLTMGVENVWLIEPWTRTAYYASLRRFEQPEDGILRLEGSPVNVQIQVVLSELFQRMSES